MKRRDICWLLLIFIVTCILLYSLFFNVRLSGHDTLGHTSDIIYFSKTISLRHIFGVNIIELPFHKFGYGMWLFYPKLPHLLGSYLYLITNDVYLSMNIIYFVVMFLSGVFTYYLSLKLFKNRKVAFLSAVIYMSYSYHICEIYVRDAFAENFMFLVIPLVFLGLLELKEGNNSKFYVFFILGYTIGMYSHLISMVFCTIFVFLYVLYHWKIYLKNSRFIPLLISSFIVTGLSLPFIVSIMEHKLFGNYIVFSEIFSSRSGTVNNLFPLIKLVENSRTALNSGILVYINYSTIVLIFITLLVFIFKRYKDDYFEKRVFLYFAFFVVVSFTSSRWLWKIIPDFLTTVQFPWRNMTFLSMIIALFAPMMFLNNYKYINKRIISGFYLLIVIFNVIDGYNNIFYFGNVEYSYDEIINSTAVMGWQKEYLPNSFTSNFYKLDNADNYGGLYIPYSYQNKDVKVKVIEENFPGIKFKVSNINSYAVIEIPRTYYLGYHLIDSKGNKYKLNESKDGYLEAKINNNGIYTLSYSGTIVDKTARVIRMFTLGVIVILGGKKLWKRKK